GLDRGFNLGFDHRQGFFIKISIGAWEPGAGARSQRQPHRSPSPPMAALERWSSAESSSSSWRAVRSSAAPTVSGYSGRASGFRHQGVPEYDSGDYEPRNSLK